MRFGHVGGSLPSVQVVWAHVGSFRLQMCVASVVRRQWQLRTGRSASLMTCRRRLRSLPPLPRGSSTRRLQVGLAIQVRLRVALSLHVGFHVSSARYL